MPAGSRLLPLRTTSAPAGVAPSILTFCRRKRTVNDLTVWQKVMFVTSSPESSKGDNPI